MIKWTIELPRAVAEDDKQSVQVEADSIEEALIEAALKLGLSNGAGKPPLGQTFNVYARVQVVAPSRVPLKSV